MLRAEDLLADRQGALVERLGLVVGALVLVEHGQVVEAEWPRRDARGRGPSRGSPGRAGRAARPRRSGPGPVERGQVVEDRGHVGMLGAEDLLPNRQGALVERLGLVVAPVVW